MDAPIVWTRRKFLGTSCIGAGTALAALEAPAFSLKTALPLAEGRLRGSESTGKSAVSAAEAVLARQLGGRAAEFHLHAIPPEGEREVFEVEASGGRVSIGGSSGVALCRGAYSYLRGACDAMIAWSGSNLNLPVKLPDYAKKRVVCPYKFVQYLNPCTYGYTMAFWDWTR